MYLYYLGCHMLSSCYLTPDLDLLRPVLLTWINNILSAIQGIIFLYVKHRNMFGLLQ